jgi:hypothetical protein
MKHEGLNRISKPEEGSLGEGGGSHFFSALNSALLLYDD